MLKEVPFCLFLTVANFRFLFTFLSPIEIEIICRRRLAFLLSGRFPFVKINMHALVVSREKHNSEQLNVSSATVSQLTKIS